MTASSGMMKILVTWYHATSRQKPFLRPTTMPFLLNQMVASLNHLRIVEHFMLNDLDMHC